MKVELRSIFKGYRVRGGAGGRVTVLAGIDLTLASGESCLIHGPSGSGKSTLLGIMAGVAKPGSGTVSWGGGALKEGIGQRPARDIGYAFQEPLFVDDLTVRENLLLPAVLAGLHSLAGRGDRLLEQCGLAGQFDYFPAALSGGERRRLALARTLLVPARLIILDEPTAYLDNIWGERLMELVMQEARVNHATLVVATHDAGLRPHFGRVMRMDDGKLTEEVSSDH